MPVVKEKGRKTVDGREEKEDTMVDGIVDLGQKKSRVGINPDTAYFVNTYL